jgi:tRNA C32,U32 (ribose-2'-O)-methylase TrmJ
MSTNAMWLCRFPTNPEFGSLNLAAALQLVSYEWRLALGRIFGGIAQT